MSATTEPAPLVPLGETDCWSYANGVIIYWGEREQVRKHDRTVYVHGGADQRPVSIPGDLYGLLRAVLVASGLTSDEASLVVECTEQHL